MRAKIYKPEYAVPENMHMVYLQLREKQSGVSLEVCNYLGERITCGDIIFLNFHHGVILNCTDVHEAFDFQRNKDGSILVVSMQEYIKAATGKDYDDYVKALIKEDKNKVVYPNFNKSGGRQNEGNKN